MTEDTNMKLTSLLYKQCARAVWEHYFRVIFALITPPLLFLVFSFVLEWFDDDEDDNKNEIEKPDSLGAPLKEVEGEIEPDKDEARHDEGTEYDETQVQEDRAIEDIKGMRRQDPTMGVHLSKQLNSHRKPPWCADRPNAEFDESTRVVRSAMDSEPRSKVTSFSVKSRTGLLSPAKASSPVQPTLDTAPELVAQIDLQVCDKSFAKPSLLTSRDCTRCLTSSDPSEFGFVKDERHRLSPDRENHNSKRKELLTGNRVVQRTVPVLLIPEDSNLPDPRPNVGIPDKSRCVQATGSLTKDSDHVQSVGTTEQETPKSLENEANIAATASNNAWQGAESRARVEPFLVMTGENKHRLEEAATSTPNILRKNGGAAHLDTPRSSNSTIPPTRLDPTIARQTKNTPRAGDYAAFMNFMKMDDPEADELRAKKQRERNVAQRERQEAYAKFKGELIGRSADID